MQHDYSWIAERLVVELFFSGAESPVYLRMLDELGVTSVAVSYFEWQRRHSTDDLYKHIPAHMKVCVTAGISRKADIDFKSFAQDYLEFCERNADQALIYDMDAAACPPKISREVRDQLSLLPNVVMFPMGEEEPADLAKQFERIGINARLSKSIPPNELRRLQATLYGSNVGDPKILRQARFAATTTFYWLSGRRFGELWVFARNKLHHYKAENLARAVKIHIHDIEAFGVDPQACLANDHQALTMMATRSLQAMADSLSKRPRDRDRPEIADAFDSTSAAALVASSATDPAALVLPNGALPLNGRPRTILPVISANNQGEVTKMESVTQSLRQCDTCFLSSCCPAYTAESSCAYEIPIEIKTDAQWEAASQVILEAQFQRVMFGTFAEQVEGSGITPRVGQEMDRFMKLLGNVKELKAPVLDPDGGVMKRLFSTDDEDEMPIGVGSPNEEDDQIVEGEIYDEEESGAFGAGDADEQENAASQSSA